MKRRIAALALAAAMILTLCGAGVLAAEDQDTETGETAQDPAGTVTYTNLERRLREASGLLPRVLLTFGPPLLALALLALSYMRLLGSTFNPFIYFRF